MEHYPVELSPIVKRYHPSPALVASGVVLFIILAGSGVFSIIYLLISGARVSVVTWGGLLFTVLLGGLVFAMSFLSHVDVRENEVSYRFLHVANSHPWSVIKSVSRPPDLFNSSRSLTVYLFASGVKRGNPRNVPIFFLTPDDQLDLYQEISDRMSGPD